MSTPPPEPRQAAEPPTSLVAALRQLLRPLVRLLLDHQITFPYLARLLRRIYVDLAEHEYALEDKAQTTTRVSLLTGIHRKDVKRLREAGSVGEAPPDAVSLGAQLVARWLGEPAYQDAAGRPRPLPRQADGDGPSFEALVESVSKDIRPRAVLDEWLRLGVAEVDADDRVRLHVRAFVPGKGFDEKAYFLGRNVHDHLAAAAHNLGGGEPPMPERSVYYDGLSPESVAELQTLAEARGTDALLEVNRRAMELQRRDRGRRDASQRINFGIYFFHGDDDREDGDGEA